MLVSQQWWQFEDVGNFIIPNNRHQHPIVDCLHTDGLLPFI